VKREEFDEIKGDTGLGDNSIRKGLEILEKYGDGRDIECSFEHDIMWAKPYSCNSFDELLEAMSDEDVKDMLNLGWMEDEDNDMWMHF